MPVILRTPTSRNDIVEILLYIRRDSPRAARRVRMAINKTFQFLAEFPLAGQDRSELAQGIRSFPVQKYRDYLVFYRPRHDGIEIVRVLHGARDLRRQFRRSP